MDGRTVRNRLIGVLVVTVGLVISVPLSAHHGGATLYTGDRVTLTGTVDTWLYSNPHCLLRFDVEGEDGQVVQWIVETQAPDSIYAAGYRANTFKSGDEVTVTLEPVMNGRPQGRVVQVVLADGRTLGGRGGGGGGAVAR